MELKDRIADRILDLEAERDRLDATITVLREILAAEDGEGEPDPGEAVAPERVSPARNGKHHGNGKPRGSGAGDGKERIVRLLSGGPKRLGELAEGAGLDPGTVSYHLKGSWFRRTNPSNRLSPWELTEEGLAAAEPPGD